jgi:hypothetical protein
VKRSIRYSLCIFAVLIFPIALHAQDFGVTIENATELDAQDNLLFSQTDKAGVWFSAKTDSMELNAQGSYWFSPTKVYFFDLDYLYFSVRFRSDDMGPSLNSAKLGRFIVSDSSRYVLDVPLDGGFLDYAFSSFTVSLYGGFSGLVWNPQTSTIDMTIADNNDKIETDGFFLGPPRIIEMLSVFIPELFQYNSLTISIIGQEDVRNPASLIPEGETVYTSSNGGALHSVYAGFGLDGSFSPTIYYNLFGYFETGTTLSFISDYSYKPIIAGVAGASCLFFLEQLLYSRIELSFVYSTGDADYTQFKEGNSSDIASMFVPISNRNIGVSFAPELGNLFFLSASWSLKPFVSARGTTLDNLQTIVQALAFFRSTTGPVSGVAINAGSSSLYLGTEADLVINYRPVSDLGISLSAGFFFADKASESSAIVDDGKPFKFTGKLELSMSM